MMVTSEGALSNKRYIKGLVSGSEFNTFDFLRQTNRIPPSELERILEYISEELQVELSTLVSEEFEGFTKLFNDIGQVGIEDFRLLEEKVSALSNSIKIVSTSAERELSSLRDILEKLRRNQLETNALHFSWRIERDLTRIERIIGPSGPQPAPIDLLLASEIFERLQLYINAASGRIEPPLEVLAKVASVTGTFYSALEDALLSCLKKRDTACWEILAEGYSRIGKSSVITSIFAEEVFKGELDQVVLSLRTRPGKEESGEMIFSRFLSLIQEVRATWFQRLIDTCELRNVFVDSILGRTFAKIVQELSFIFSPALPDQFHDNFIASCYFIERIATMLRPFERRELDSNESFQTYARSWQLNVYYQLRFRDVSQTIESALVEMAGPERHPALTVLENICKQLASEKVVLRPLIPRFLRLRIQTMARVSHWFVEGGMDSAASIERAQAMAKGHREVLCVVQKILSTSPDPLVAQLNAQTVQKIHARFINKIIERQKQLESHLDQQVLGNLGRSIESMHISSHRPLNLAAPIKSWWELSQGGENAANAHRCWQSVTTQFCTRADEVIKQSRKAVANFRRLKAIMKEEPLTDEHDKELQQRQLFKVLHHEALSLISLSDELEIGESDAKRRLESLLEEVSSGIGGA